MKIEKMFIPVYNIFMDNLIQGKTSAPAVKKYVLKKQETVSQYKIGK